MSRLRSRGLFACARIDIFDGTVTDFQYLLHGHLLRGAGQLLIGDRGKAAQNRFAYLTRAWRTFDLAALPQVALRAASIGSNEALDRL